MAANIDLKVESTTNPCCTKWEERFLKLQHKLKKTEDGRLALKKAVGIYEQQFEKMQNEKLQLKKAYEEEKLQTDHERKEKEKESAARVSIENEISTLKAEISSLSKKGGSVSESTSEELVLLKGRVFDKEKEINCLQEEKKRANVEKSKIEHELSNLKTQLLNVETEKKKLTQDLLKERARAESEKKRTDEMSKTLKTKQAEVEVLKSEKKNNDLSSQKSEHQNLETEIGRLKELYENERKRADCEAKKADTEKKNTHKVKEMLKAEQSKVDEQRKLFDVERKKTEEFARQLQKLKCEADEAKAKLVSEGLNFKKANKKFEAEKKKSIKEKKKAEDQQKIAEMSTKHALEEKQNAVRLQQQLDDCRNKYDKLKKEMENYETNIKQKPILVGNGVDLNMVKETEYKKAAEMYKLQAVKEKSRADKLAQRLEDTLKRTKNEHKVTPDLVSSKSLTEMKLLKKRLKLEKDRRKHFNQVVEHEKKCKKTVEEELHRLKLEFARFSSRVGLCSCFDVCNVGKSCLEKNGNVISEGKELLKVIKPSEYIKPNLDASTPSVPISGTCTESTSGTASKMEPLCNRKNIDSFALVSSMASFSDRQLVPVSRLSGENAEVVDNNVKNALNIRNKDVNTKKRKRVLNACESVEHLPSEGKTRHSKLAKNVCELPLAIEHNKEEGIRTVENVDLENFKKTFDGDCMKLLNFDSEVEEERYRAAVERPLSPTLPNIEYKSNVIDLDDSRPSESEIPVVAIEPWSIVVFSDIRDGGSLSEIFHMTKAFSTHCCAFSQIELAVKNIIATLSADEVLSPKEKVCAFFSLFLKSFSSIALTNFNHANDGNFCRSIRIVSEQLKKVLSDKETRARFSKVCGLEELITLVQNFLINGEILVCSTETSSETLSLPESKASPHALVVGAVLLASVCDAFDRVDFLCEMSYTLSRITSPLTLTLLHVFAYVCGEKLLNHGDYNLIMTVIKSLVIFCESENVSSVFPSCDKCPFSIGAVSMEELASILLKTYTSLTVSDDALSDLGDVMSLLELLATKTSWGWVSKNIVSELLKMSEACVKETLLTSIFVLLGQMARLGIDANGIQDAGVESIRVKLISFISKSISSEISLPVQFAAVTALLGTTPLSFQEICKNSLELPTLPPPVRSATDCIQRWFSLLSDERKSLSVRLLTPDAS
ncbi:hypothetical protein HanXRQr2_Chr17g0792871 [Helianthus annuus]|uniref:Maternal effect embryo arrest 22 n=1 Tax=Helianthus annuus TaxID=4232 RepID=A0A9K3DH39_HELAN|nr:hypothetical protein HanXRQr2_Chr17g0792871 [Helianthus annuus]KAJ0432536.1 hypothetical protein HanIR_Chr17g0860311 [Helianthus annuus]KAJ0812333.1 hypothetical protein HanPSC8_Chr17g0760861 [Helianthus annuus]